MNPDCQAPIGVGRRVTRHVPSNLPRQPQVAWLTGSHGCTAHRPFHARVRTKSVARAIVVAVPPGRRRPTRDRGRATRSSGSTASCPATSSSGSCAADEAEIDLEVSRGGLELSISIAQARPASRSAPRCRARCSTACAPATTTASSASSTSCPRACGRSLYLKDDDYRLSLPVRELHHAHPLHRGRPRTGDHRAAVAAAREHPRHRSRRAQPDAAEPARRHEPALAAGPARPRHRRARPDRGVPGRQRRRGPRRHVRRHPRPVPRARLGGASCRSASRKFNREPAMRLHTVEEAARGRRRRRGLAGRVPGHARPADGATPPTSTT